MTGISNNETVTVQLHILLFFCLCDNCVNDSNLQLYTMSVRIDMLCRRVRDKPNTHHCYGVICSSGLTYFITVTLQTQAIESIFAHQFTLIPSHQQNQYSDTQSHVK